MSFSVFLCSHELTARWWDLRTLSQTASLDLEEPITSMELAHGGGTLSVTAGSKVHFLDILRQHPPVTVPLPHPPTSASLHPFLRDRFVTGSTNDPWVRVYDLDSGTEKEVYKGHHGPVLCASYSPDGEVYASGSEDGELAQTEAEPLADGQAPSDCGRPIRASRTVFGRRRSRPRIRPSRLVQRGHPRAVVEDDEEGGGKRETGRKEEGDLRPDEAPVRFTSTPSSVAIAHDTTLVFRAFHVVTCQTCI